MLQNIKFEEIYKEFHPKILKFLKSKTSSKEDAEDLTSIVFEKALKGIDNFKWQGVPFSAWLYKIARNTLIDFYRRKKEVRSTNEIIETKSHPVNIEQDAFSDLFFEQILYSLKPRERKIIYMKFFEGHTNKNIADKLNLTETNVATIIHRIIKNLKMVSLLS